MLVDRTFKINSTWVGFHNNIKELTNILEKNHFPSGLVNHIVQQFLNKFFASTSGASAVTSPNETSTHYFKLPFVCPFLSIVQHRIRCLTQRFCKLLFAVYKVTNSVKDAIPKTLQSSVVYKFSCTGCNACYIGETNRHLAIHVRVREHLKCLSPLHSFNEFRKFMHV